MKYLFLIALTACGIEHDDGSLHGYGDQEEFLEYRQSYEEMTGRNTDHIEILFGDFSNKKSTVNGFCSSEYNVIRISEKRWNLISETTKEVLIIHELGHCDADLRHDENKIGFEPVSIMYPWVDHITPSNWRNNRDLYANQLRNKIEGETK